MKRITMRPAFIPLNMRWLNNQMKYPIDTKYYLTEVYFLRIFAP